VVSAASEIWLVVRPQTLSDLKVLAVLMELSTRVAMTTVC